MSASAHAAAHATDGRAASAAPLRQVETVIVGSGFSGLLAAIRLQKRGFDDFVLLERSGELGGTWQVNSYPGAEVDIPTSLYCISFIPYPFRKTFAPQSELLAYTNHIIERFGLSRYARTHQTVTRLTFDERACRWQVETESGEQYTARFVIDTSGSKPSMKVMMCVHWLDPQRRFRSQILDWRR